MPETTDFWKKMLSATQRAIRLELVDNISFVYLRQNGEKDYLLPYGFKNEPSEDDLEALSLIETEIVSDVWSWVGEVRYEWSVAVNLPAYLENISGSVVYQNGISNLT